MPAISDSRQGAHQNGLGLWVSLLVRFLKGRLPMSELSRDDVISQLGPLGDITVAEVIATGITLEELKVAREEIAKDESGSNSEIWLPHGPVGRVIDIVERVRD